MNNWPFKSSALMAGLRRYLDMPGLRLNKIQPMQRSDVFPGDFGEQLGTYTMQPLLAEVEVEGSQYQMGLTLKQGQESLLTCEYDLYKFLAMELPVVVPGMIAGEPEKGWLVLEKFEDLRPSGEWGADDYRQAADNLAILHDRFWGLQEDLDNFGRLSRPLDRDYQAVIENCRGAVQTLHQTRAGELSSARYQAAFDALIQHADHISEPLKAQEFGLVHGAYWADNIACPIDGGRQIITSWQHAAIAPNILDVVFFYHQSDAHLSPALPLEGILARYRMQLELAPRAITWPDEDWEQLWDHALMWVFMTHWLDWLARCSSGNDGTIDPWFKMHWLNPVLDVLETRLDVRLPSL